MRIRLTIEYDGTAYSGWQAQASNDSVQDSLEAALERLYGSSLRLSASGRTDAGVHARGQVAAFTPPRSMDLAVVQRALNALTPDDIVIREVSAAADDFDPRRHARGRIYQYRILNQPLPSAFERRYAWHIAEPLEVAAMERAAQLFIGVHDFAAFRTMGSEVSSTIREIRQSHWRTSGSILTYRVEGSSFLRHMVRTMVAAMVEVGRGRAAAALITQLLQTSQRGAAPAAAPPNGLTLVEVQY